MKDAMDTLDGMIPEGAKPREPRGVWWYRFAVLLLLVLVVVVGASAFMWSDNHNDGRYVNETDAASVVAEHGDKRYMTIQSANQQFADLRSGQGAIAAGVDKKLDSMQTDIREIRNILLQQSHPRRE